MERMEGLQNGRIAKSLIKTVLSKKGVYVVFGKAKRRNDRHKVLLRRISKAECVEEKMEIYSKTATGCSRQDHAISIRSDENGVRLLDNACTSGSIDCSVESLADRMVDLTYCFYFNEGWKE